MTSLKGAMRYKNLGDLEISDLIRSAHLQPDAINRANIYDQVLQGTLFMVERLTKKYSDYSSYEDLKQIGRITLYQAILTFHPDKCPKFYGWAVRWVKKNIAIAAYKTKQYFEANDFTEDALTLASEILVEVTPEDILIDEEQREIIWNIVKETGYIGSQILINIYLENMSDEECSCVLGISRSKLLNIKNLAFNILRNNAELARVIE